MKNNFDSNAFFHKTYRVCELYIDKKPKSRIYLVVLLGRGGCGEDFTGHLRSDCEDGPWRFSAKKNVLQNFQLYLKHSSALDYKWKNQYARNWGFHLEKQNWKILNSKVNIQVILARCVSKMLRVCFTRREKRWNYK